MIGYGEAIVDKGLGMGPIHLVRFVIATLKLKVNGTSCSTMVSISSSK